MNFQTITFTLTIKPKNDDKFSSLYISGPVTSAVKVSIKDLFRDFFFFQNVTVTGSETDTSPECKGYLIPDIEHVCNTSDSGILEHLLPKAIYDELSEWMKGHTVETDLKEFMLDSTNNNKISNAIFDIFAGNLGNADITGRHFIEKFEEHFKDLLSGAAFGDDLKDYLLEIAKYIVPPKNKSHPDGSNSANAAFCATVNKRDHDETATLIGRVFAAVILGVSAVTYNKTQKARIYKLSRAGLDFIFLPEKQDYEFSHACGEYESGDFESAAADMRSWLQEYEGKVSNENRAKAYFILGKCLNNSPAEQLKAYEKCIAYGGGSEYAEAFYQIGINCIESGIDGEDFSKGVDHMKKALEFRFIPAVIYLAVGFFADGADALIKKTLSYDELTAALKDAVENFDKEPGLCSDTDKGRCFYYLAKLIKEKSPAEAEHFIERAASFGNDAAKHELTQKKRELLKKKPRFTNAENAPCLIVNAANGSNTAVMYSLPDLEWSVFTLHDIESSANENTNPLEEFIRKAVFGSDKERKPRIVFAFMSSDEEANISDCLALTDTLFNLALEKGGSQREKLIDAVEIFVAADYETAAVLTDADISDMGDDIYFKIYIKDIKRDSAHYLLTNAPLFIPLLNKKANAVNVVLFGAGDANYRIMKESLACAYIGENHPVTLTMLGKDAPHYEKMLKKECSGLFSETGRLIKRVNTAFIECDIREEDFPRIIYGAADDGADSALSAALENGNYFVVDFSNDLENISFASNLRSWLLKSGGSFDRAPFIAVKCASPKNAYLAPRLTLSGRAAGTSYYNKYDLFAFGSPDTLYSLGNLSGNAPLERTAFKIHASYGGGSIRQAENDYFSYSYNADSSLLTAIGLVYRFFAAGVHFNDKSDYMNAGVFRNHAQLLSRFSDIIADADRLETAAAVEQARWNGFMLSRGWEGADSDLVNAYQAQATGSAHKHILAKMHPFIRNWEDLDGADLRKILGILKRVKYKNAPKETTKKNITDTVLYF